jgi:hypothetical protein
MTGFLPEPPGVIRVELIAELRRLHFVERVKLSELARRFNISRPTVRKHLQTVGDPVYPAENSKLIPSWTLSAPSKRLAGIGHVLAEDTPSRGTASV